MTIPYMEIMGSLDPSTFGSIWLEASPPILQLSPQVLDVFVTSIPGIPQKAGQLVAGFVKKPEGKEGQPFTMIKYMNLWLSRQTSKRWLIYTEIYCNTILSIISLEYQ